MKRVQHLYQSGLQWVTRTCKFLKPHRWVYPDSCDEALNHCSAFKQLRFRADSLVLSERKADLCKNICGLKKISGFEWRGTNSHIRQKTRCCRVRKAVERET